METFLDRHYEGDPDPCPGCWVVWGLMLLAATFLVVANSGVLK